MNMPVVSSFVEVALPADSALIAPHAEARTLSAFTAATLPISSRLTTYEPGSSTRDNGSSLLEQIASGSSVAFEKFVETYRSRMHAVARRMLRCDNEADDAVQDALICIYRKASTFKAQSNLWTWIHRVVVNASLMRIRSTREMSPLDTIEQTAVNTSDASPHGSMLEEMERDELKEKVRECIAQLQPAYRDIIQLRDLDELDTESTAMRLGISPANVKTRLHRARTALRAILVAEGQLASL